MVFNPLRKLVIQPFNIAFDSLNRMIAFISVNQARNWYR